MLLPTGLHQLDSAAKGDFRLQVRVDCPAQSRSPRQVQEAQRVMECSGLGRPGRRAVRCIVIVFYMHAHNDNK